MSKIEVTQAQKAEIAAICINHGVRPASSALVTELARHCIAAQEAAIKAAIEAAAKVCDERGAAEQADFGLGRGAQNYFRARNAIRGLTVEQIMKGMGE